MYTRTITAVSALSMLGGAAFAQSDSADMGFALANDGMTLVSMADITSPTDVQTMDLSEALDAIAWRPVTGELLGFRNGMVVTIDTASGEMTDLEAAFNDDAMVADGSKVAFDFNNKIDAVRAVSSGEDNLVYFPKDFSAEDKAGKVVRVTDLAYAEGDANAGADPMIYANAYTNAINGETAGSTFQYALDAETDSLVSLANNEGTLETIAEVTVDGEAVDLSDWGGFDIMSPSEGEDMAYAILQMEGAETAGFYTINLETGEAMMEADLGMGGFTALAIAQAR
ncbi:DUF4394 domain-containing protein [Roseovarius atlanticus]|uniref:DUF4394 domain-containing protein n=1 Tax=Roseovarius atlanticus TaxID=1641875 RepID=UPI001C95008A|nr:DUF4394 domain-containing protein [Roseovarius atlanticus]MBY5987622.1 DUF4394 domain-containing protein [Roseovarius atlanticus]MBY6123013.1 DUF4394 domain-containing protein [Roseovarius atlanticus]MBY6147509.1 DUF4394 domain-containing protein [Roseovarius atlanticus]